MLKPSKDDPNHDERMKDFNRDNGQWGGDIQKHEKFVPKDEPKKEQK